MPKLYILRGAPGSGKTTLATTMLEQGIVDKHFEADMWFEGKHGYKWRAQHLRDAHHWCFLSVQGALHGGYNVVVACCFAKRHQVQDYVDMGFETEVITLEGKHENVHNVPPSKVDHIRSIMEPWEPIERGIILPKIPGYGGVDYAGDYA